MNNHSISTTPNQTDEQVRVSKDVLNDIADYIKMELGAPIVDVELSDQAILIIINRALRLISKYNLIKLWFTTVLVNKTVDLSILPHQVSYVIDVLKSKGDSLTNTTAMSSMFGFPVGLKVARTSYGYPYGSLNDITSIFNESVLMQKNLMSFKDNISFDIDRTTNTLYIDTGLVGEYNITIEYVPVLTIDDLYLLRSNQDALDVLMKLSLGYSMTSLGRARGKYSTNNYNWSLSSDELLSTGKQLISDTESFLNHNYSHILAD